MYIMPQHMQWYHLTTQGNIYLCKTALFPLWPQKDMDESTMIKDTPAGNVMLSAAILFSGSTPGKILRLMNEMRIACICDSTFYNHQTAYLYPAVVSVWESHQTKLLAECRSRGTALSIGGDGKADSPGHSAKYGSYRLIDFDSNKIIHMELVQVKFAHCFYIICDWICSQSNQVTSSNHMEKEGLSRALKFLDAKSLQVGTLVTDRHLSKLTSLSVGNTQTLNIAMMCGMCQKVR